MKWEQRKGEIARRIDNADVTNNCINCSEMGMTDPDNAYK